ncbi:Elongation factor Tu GTP binding domain [Carpediemonas membranifera]|uniref:Elongation factor Tu GTP binding domain n=1 Tax=Carpediemonas membranifera TaxID=201153 RepID=A0A8J6B692_9EUKA|nr:Elongation factor Tu GTP binding domain [Carpediemonas membranifera]|eukprot:KAG9395149.1 Elongation factor Tu GTP binding domain [Carpediemonas membranifera]
MDFARMLLAMPTYGSSCRTVAVVGPYGSGKTELCEFLFDGPSCLQEEEDRHMTMFTKPIMSQCSDSNGRTLLVTALDTPGFGEFVGSALQALTMANSALVVVDAIHGISGIARDVLRTVAEQHKPMTLVVNQADRLVTELQLPPETAYQKLDFVISEANAVLHTVDPTYPALSPLEHTALVASARDRWVLDPVELGAELYGDAINPARLWGDWFRQPDGRLSRRPGPDGPVNRIATVVLLEPIYKLYALMAGGKPGELDAALKTQGLTLKAKEYALNPADLIKLVFGQRWPRSRAGGGSKWMLVDRLSDHPDMTAAPTVTLPAAVETQARPDSVVAMVSHIIPVQGSSHHYAMVTVLRGQLVPGARLYVLGGDMATGDIRQSVSVDSVRVPMGADFIDLDVAPANTIVVIPSIANRIPYPALLVSGEIFDGIKDAPQLSATAASALVPALPPHMPPALTVAVEPLIPTMEFDRLDTDSDTPPLEVVRRRFPAVKIGHVGGGLCDGRFLRAPGEVTLDAALKALREVSGIEVRVSLPHGVFYETPTAQGGGEAVVEAPLGTLVKSTRTPEAVFRVRATAVPVRDRSVELPADRIAEMRDAATEELQTRTLRSDFYPLSHFEAASLVAADQTTGSFLLCGTTERLHTADLQLELLPPAHADEQLDLERRTETLRDTANRLGLTPHPSAAPRSSLQVRQAVIRGFQAAVEAGPLCMEPVAGCVFTIDFPGWVGDFSQLSLPGLVTMVTKALHAALVHAEPRLIETVVDCELVHQNSSAVRGAVDAIVRHRRGRVVASEAIPATRLQLTGAEIPALEAPGLGVDAGLHTGFAVLQPLGSGLKLLDSDPFSGIETAVLTPATEEGLAADIMTKLRRRRGEDDFDPSRWTDV